MFRYQNTKRFLGILADDCKKLGAQELQELGAKNTELDYRAVYFDAKPGDLYKIAYCNRLFSRIMAPLHRFDCHHDDILYKRGKQMQWEKILSPEKTFAIFANVGNSNIRHSKFAAQRLKDAICDYFVDRCGERPSVDTENPDVWLNLHINKNKATINIDLMGQTGHKRGYRTTSVEAPMRETLAAAIVRESGWDGQTPLYDFMCGSGTLAIEAMMSYCRIPARYNQEKFGFENLPDFSLGLWESVKHDADSKMRPLEPGMIFASDMNKEAISSVIENTEALPFGDRIEVKTCKFQDVGPINDATIISNPPYGVRLETGTDDPGEFMKEIGDFLKQQCTGTTAWLYIGSTKLVKRVGLRPACRIPLDNGGIDGRLIRLDMYSGTLNP